MPSKCRTIITSVTLSVFVCFLYHIFINCGTKTIVSHTGNTIVRFKDMELKQSLEYKVYGLNSTCKAYFSSSLKENLNVLLRMKTDSKTEHYLHELGFPRRTEKVDDLEIPGYVRRTIKSKIPTIVCAASSNHFRELQALFLHIDTEIRRYFPNIRVIFYDIGLTEQERKQILNYGKVELRRFDFNRFPPHYRILHICAWKPTIIQEVFKEVGYVMYMDTSLRLNASRLQEHFTRSESTGHLLKSHPATPNYPNTIPTNTFSGTFDYFHVSPCLFHNIPEIGSGLMILRSDNVVSLLIMRSWMACALQERCIMPVGAEKRPVCTKPGVYYHKCHREDQSVLGIAILLLYHQPHNVPLIPYSSFSAKRGEKSDYLINKKLVKS